MDRKMIKEIKFLDTDGQRFIERYNRKGQIVSKVDNIYGREWWDYFGNATPVHYKKVSDDCIPNQDIWGINQVEEFLSEPPLFGGVEMEELDSHNRTTYRKYESGLEEWYFYTEFPDGGYSVEVEDSDGCVEIRTYNDKGLLILVETPYNDFFEWKKFEYDKYGNRVHCVFSNGREWWKEYKYHH